MAAELNFKILTVLSNVISSATDGPLSWWCCQTNLNTRKRYLKSIIMRHRNWTTPWEQLYVFAWRIVCFLDAFGGWSSYRFDCDNWQISEVPQPSWNAASLVLIVEMADVNFASVVGPAAAKLSVSNSNLTKSCSVGWQLVCCDNLWWSVLSHYFYEELLCCSLVASFCNKAFKNFAFMINGAPKVKSHCLFWRRLRQNTIASSSGAPASS